MILRVQRVFIVGRRLLLDVLAGRLVRPLGLDQLEQNRRDVVVAARAVRGLDQRACGCVEIGAVIAHDRFDLDSVDHVGEPVRADQVEVAYFRLDGERIDVDVRVGAQRAGDHRALRVHLGRFG